MIDAIAGGYLRWADVHTSDSTKEAGMQSCNDACGPLSVFFLRKQGVIGIRFRKHDIAVLLENQNLLVTIRPTYVIRPSFSHLVPQFASTTGSVGSKI
jgi:hypothetical protein